MSKTTYCVISSADDAAIYLRKALGPYAENAIARLERAPIIGETTYVTIEKFDRLRDANDLAENVKMTLAWLAGSQGQPLNTTTVNVIPL